MLECEEVGHLDFRVGLRKSHKPSYSLPASLTAACPGGGQTVHFAIKRITTPKIARTSRLTA